MQLYVHVASVEVYEQKLHVKYLQLLPGFGDSNMISFDLLVCQCHNQFLQQITLGHSVSP